MTNQLLEQIPKDWRSRSQNVLLSGYRIIGLSKDNFVDSTFKELILDDVKVIFYWGHISYLDTNAIRVKHSSDGLKKTIHNFDTFVSGEEGAYCLILTPLLEEGPEVIQGDSISKIQVISGFFKMIYEHHFEKLFDNILNLETNKPGHIGFLLMPFKPHTLNKINQDFLDIVQLAVKNMGVERLNS